MIGVAAMTLILTLHPRVMRSNAWRATVTPLASIIGSGFLVAAPVLGVTAGSLAVVAMAFLCGAGFLFGSAIRTNIRYAEPLRDDPPRWLSVLEGASRFALLLAYFISVAYYLNLFAAFGLRLVGIEARFGVRVAASAAIALIGAVGYFRGLGWLENIELPTVGVKLALIAGVTAALLVFDAGAWSAGTLALPPGDVLFDVDSIRTILGLMVLVQGFETSRYLGDSYDAETRIRTMRRAQIVATVIYLLFVGLATPFLGAATLGPESETEVIDLLAPLGWALMPLIACAALASQFSAGVADAGGAGGLAEEASGGRVATHLGYAITAAVAIAITWVADIYVIIVWASKAFLLYYGLQSAIAFQLTRAGDARSPVRAAFAGLGVILAAAAIALGTAAA